MFGQCGHKVEAEIAREYARVSCSLVDREVKLGGRATLMDAMKKLCYHCQETDRRLVTSLNADKKEEF